MFCVRQSSVRGCRIILYLFILLLSVLMKLPPGFRHQCNEVSRYGKKDAGTGEHLKTLRLLDKKKKTKQRGGWSQCVCLKFLGQT